MFRLLVKKYRIMKNISQEELANRSGLSQSYIAKLEKENVIRKISPRLMTLVNLAKALDVCPMALISEDCENCNIYDGCNRQDKTL